MSGAYVALDRDGTLIEERHYLADPEQVTLLPGVGPALRALAALRLPLVVVTNQSALGRGLLDEAGLDAIHARLRALLAAEQVRLDGIYYCPHVPEDACACRKPARGLLDRAARELGLALAAGFVVGDKACDIDLGAAVGATTFLVRTGHGAAQEPATAARADFTVASLAHAVGHIERLMRERAAP